MGSAKQNEKRVHQIDTRPRNVWLAEERSYSWEEEIDYTIEKKIKRAASFLALGPRFTVALNTLHSC